MTGERKLDLTPKKLEECLADGNFHVKNHLIDDIIRGSRSYELIRDSLSTLIGIYRAVKNSLKEEGINSVIGYYEGEALLDSYAANIAADRALSMIASAASKSFEMRSLFYGSIHYLKSERNVSMREKQLIGDFLSCYQEAALNIRPDLISDLTMSYLEWLIQTSSDFSSSIPSGSSFEREIKRYSIVFPDGKGYSGFVKPRKENKKDIAMNRKKEKKEGRQEEDPGQDHENHYLVTCIEDVTFKNVGGLETQKELVERVIRLPLQRKDGFREMKGIEPSKGLIFYGPTGTGKTYLAKAVANEMKLPFFYICASEFMQKYVGDGEKKVRELFQHARVLAPSIIFVDEGDASFSSRDSEHGRYTSGIVNQILTEIDGFNPLDSVKVIVATNYYERMDRAFKGRIAEKYHLEFPLPDEQQRHKAIEAITSSLPINGVDIGFLAEQTEGANFRALKFICNEAGIYAIEEGQKKILKSHFDKALNEYKTNAKKYRFI